MMGSFSISSCISLILSISLILITGETPLKYKPITCLLKVFSVLSHFSWCSCYLYSLNGLLMALPLAWSTLYMYCLMLSSSKHSCFLCCSMHSFSLARVSAKISSLFNTFCTIDMIFITYQNPHNMTNNITYKDSVNVKNDTLIYQKLDIKSVIIFLIDGFAFMVEKKKLHMPTLSNRNPKIYTTHLSLWGKGYKDAAMSGQAILNQFCTFQSHHQLQDALDVGLLKHVSLPSFD